jgi:sugar phosphate isomerase/epimerase
MKVFEMIGISCPGFCMTPFGDMLSKIAPHFKLWEIIAEAKHKMAQIKNEIKDAMDSYDIRFTVHAPFSDLNLASLNPKIRESSVAQISESIRISSELGISVVTLHPGHKAPLAVYFSDMFVKTNKKSLRELDKFGEEYGVVLALENMPRMWISLCHDAKELKELIEGTNMKICFDFGHANISNDIPGLMGLKKDFANIHIHDNDGKIDRHKVLGQGEIDFADILKELKGYKGDYIIESTNLEEGMESKIILEKMLKDI